MSARKQVTKTLVNSYRLGNKRAKSQILDELVELTGWHRDYARTAPRDAQAAQATSVRAGRKPIYPADLQPGLILCWSVLVCAACPSFQTPRGLHAVPGAQATRREGLRCHGCPSANVDENQRLDHRREACQRMQENAASWPFSYRARLTVEVLDPHRDVGTMGRCRARICRARLGWS